jgi:hypothetical protein
MKIDAWYREYARKMTEKRKEASAWYYECWKANVLAIPYRENTRRIQEFNRLGLQGFLNWMNVKP